MKTFTLQLTADDLDAIGVLVQMFSARLQNLAQNLNTQIAGQQEPPNDPPVPRPAGE